MATKASFHEQSKWLIGLQSSSILAFETIYEHFFPVLYSVAYNYIRDKALAEEIVQDLFTNLWLKRYQLTVQGSLEAYLLRAIRNMINDHIDKRRVRFKVHEQLLFLGSDASFITDESIEYEDLVTQLTQALDYLPQLTQRIFRMSRFEYLPVADIAQQLNLSSKAIEYHITRAIKFLRIHLKDFLVIIVLMIFKQLT